MHTVIVGGGFAGVKAALELSKKQLGMITLISDEEHFLHHATLYSTATGRDPLESVISLKDIFAQHHDVDVEHDSVVSLDTTSRTVTCASGKQLSYDILVIAIGMVTTYFGIDGMEQHSYSIKTLAELKRFREQLKDDILDSQQMTKTYVVVGGGPTGVEIAGALAPYLQEVVAQHMTRQPKISILLVEAAPRILPRSSKAASKRVKRRLEQLGVTVLENHKVDALSSDVITVDGEKIPTETVIWTSGVMNNPFFKQHPEIFRIAKNGRVEVNQYLEAAPDVYVIGDNANVSNAGMAYPALDTGEFLADHLVRRFSGAWLRPYSARKPTSGIPVGENWAFVEKGIFRASGYIGHLIRRRIELRGYERLVSKNLARAAWQAHYRKVDL